MTLRKIVIIQSFANTQKLRKKMKKEKAPTTMDVFDMG